MTKDQLKSGDRLTLRNGEVWHIGNTDFYISEYLEDLLYEDYNDLYDDLGNKLTTGKNNHSYDIVKVERIQIDYQKYDNCVSTDNWEDDIKDINNSLVYQTIWKREEVNNHMPKSIKDTFVPYAEQPKKIELMQRIVSNGSYIEDFMNMLSDKINEIVEVLNE